MTSHFKPKRIKRLPDQVYLKMAHAFDWDIGKIAFDVPEKVKEAKKKKE